MTATIFVLIIIGIFIATLFALLYLTWAEAIVREEHIEQESRRNEHDEP